METILLVILVVIAVVMIGCVLLQRSEGGALGIGGPGAMFTARGSASFLTRVTAILAALFMILSLVLAVLGGGQSDRGGSVMDVSEEGEAGDFEPIELQPVSPSDEPGQAGEDTSMPPAESAPDDGPQVPLAE